MRSILIIIIFIKSIACCGQEIENSSDNIQIDKGVEIVVESKISPAQHWPRIDHLMFYNNTLEVDYFENESLKLLDQREDGKLIFTSHYYDQNDTLTIDGLFGIFNGFGFSIKIFDGKATVYHKLVSPDNPTYSMNENDSLEIELQVPCTNSKLTLSKMPEYKSGEVVYGIVEFESGTYYQSSPTPQDIIFEIIENETGVYLYNNYNRDKPSPGDNVLKKVRMNMKIHFKTMYLKMEN